MKRAPPFVVSVNVVASVVSVSVLCDQDDQVVPAHQVDDIDEVHELDPVHQVDHKDEPRFCVEVIRCCAPCGRQCAPKYFFFSKYPTLPTYQFLPKYEGNRPKIKT